MRGMGKYNKLLSGKTSGISCMDTNNGNATMKRIIGCYIIAAFILGAAWLAVVAASALVG